MANRSTVSNLRVRYWAATYAKRWKLEEADIVSELLCLDSLALPHDILPQLQLLHKIADRMDEIISRDSQWLYWHAPMRTGARLVANYLGITKGGCLKAILSHLSQLQSLPDGCKTVFRLRDVTDSRVCVHTPIEQFPD